MVINYGVRAENVVHEICKKMFLSDFVVCNPKFKKKPNVEHEISDTLVLFKNNLIGFQVKTKLSPHKFKDKSQIEQDRIRRVIEEGISQLSSINSALKKHDVLTLDNSIGVKVELTSANVQKIFGIVIIDLIGEEILEEDDRSYIKRGFIFHKKIPTHIFIKSDFELISTEIDTLPDFIRYLEVREQLYSQELLPFELLERDLLAYYKLDPSKLMEAIKSNVILFILPGFWNTYKTEYQALIEQRNEINKPSYFLDEIIESLHKSIGTNPSLIETFSNEQAHKNTHHEYFSIITEFASLDRLSRRGYATKLLAVMERANSKLNGSYTLIINPDNKTGYIFYASSKPRNERLSFLETLIRAAYCRFNLNKVVALSTDQLSAQEYYYEIRSFENVTFKNHKELCTLGKRLFKGTQVESSTEYQAKQKISKKFSRNAKCPCQSGRKYKNCCAR